MRRSLAWTGIVLLGIGAWQASPWGAAWRAQRAEDARWKPWVDEKFDEGEDAHRLRWDNLVRLMDDGFLALKAWPHAMLASIPRQAFRAELKLRPSNLPAWAELGVADTVEYFKSPLAPAGFDLPRARFSGLVGRLDLAEDGWATLSVLQRALDGRVIAQSSLGVAVPRRGHLTLKLSREGDRLRLQLGDDKVETLVLEPQRNEGLEQRLCIAGEGVLAERLKAQTLHAPGDLSMVAQAEIFELKDRPQDAAPMYSDLARMTEGEDRARWELREGHALLKAAMRSGADEILAQMLADAPQGFHAGYARLALAESLAGQGKDGWQALLQELYQKQPEHPAAGAAMVLHAKLLAQAGQSAPALELAKSVLSQGDAAAALQALDLLSQPPFALTPVEQLNLLRARSHNGGAPALLAAQLARRKAALEASLGFVPGLVTTLQGSLGLPRPDREALYELADGVLRSRKSVDAQALWDELGLKPGDGDRLLRDWLALEGYGWYRHDPLGSGRPAYQVAMAELLRKHRSLPDFPAPKTPRRPFVDPKAKAQPTSYGELAQKAPFFDPEDGLCLLFQSGTYWGCGISIPASQAPLLKGGAMDLSGYKYLNAEVRAPKGLEYYFSLSESGVAAPEFDDFSGENGADGEQYLFDGRVANGEWQAVKLPLAEAAPAFNWGDPHGNQRLDLQAVNKLDLAIPGKNGAGRISVRKIEFSVD
jgi:hypothetical protein